MVSPRKTAATTRVAGTNKGAVVGRLGAGVENVDAARRDVGLLSGEHGAAVAHHVLRVGLRHRFKCW